MESRRFVVVFLIVCAVSSAGLVAYLFLADSESARCTEDESIFRAL